MYKAKDILNINSLQILYYSFILPYITYCVEVWGKTYQTIINQIFLLQKRAIRIINRADYREPTNKLFINSQALKFSELVDFKISLLMCKAYNNLLPDCIQKLFQKRQYEYELRGSCMSTKTKSRINVKQESVYGVNLWNALETEMKECSTCKRFKKLFQHKMIFKYKSNVWVHECTCEVSMILDRQQVYVQSICICFLLLSLLLSIHLKGADRNVL